MQVHPSAQLPNPPPYCAKWRLHLNKFLALARPQPLLRASFSFAKLSITPHLLGHGFTCLGMASDNGA